MSEDSYETSDPLVIAAVRDQHATIARLAAENARLRSYLTWALEFAVIAINGERLVCIEDPKDMATLREARAALEQEPKP